ncbi:MAG TPA: IclR family transcriptional regulator, partial [Terriglobales bacterium]
MAAHKEDIPLATLAQSVGLKKTITWRLVHTLVQLGYVRQDPKTRHFRPAPRVLSLGYSYFDGLDLRQLAAPFLDDLATRFNEAVNLAVLDGDEVIFLERIGSSHIISINLHIGSRLPLYSTSLGRALICEMPKEWLRAYMGRLTSDQRARDYLNAGEKILPKILEETRRLGYALNDQELVNGLRAVASPIRDATNEIIGAVGVGAPSSRVSLTELRRNIAREVISTAAKISMALGYKKI